MSRSLDLRPIMNERKRREGGEKRGKGVLRVRDSHH